MEDLCFYVLFNIFEFNQDNGNDNERLCAMEPLLGLKIFPFPPGIKFGMAKSAGQRLTP